MRSRHTGSPPVRCAQPLLFDRTGNVGPTVWWGGEVVGGWAVRPDGSVATELLVDRGDDARTAVAAAAETLSTRLCATVVVPS